MPTQPPPQYLTSQTSLQFLKVRPRPVIPGLLLAAQGESLSSRRGRSPHLSSSSTQVWSGQHSSGFRCSFPAQGLDPFTLSSQPFGCHPQATLQSTRLYEGHLWRLPRPPESLTYPLHWKPKEPLKVQLVAPASPQVPPKRTAEQCQ